MTQCERRNPSQHVADTARMLRVKSFGRTALLVVLIASAAACVKWFPGKVGTGVARLSVRNIGAVVSLISNDTTCGFASEAVLAAPIVEGPVGGTGKVTWIVKGCTLDLGKGTEVSRDCQGNITTAAGKITVSAEKTVVGRITGSQETPVVPDGPDSATITLSDVSFDRFLVKKSNSDSQLRIKKGKATATVHPRLAAAADSGACAIATPNVTFEAINLSGAEAHVKSPDNEFDVEVRSSNLDAQNGIGGGKENSLNGSIVVWDSEEAVPTDGDTDGLDPEYKRADFEASYACTPNIVFPVSYRCDIEPQLAQGAGSLTIKTLGTVLSLVNDDVACGFSAPSVQASAVLRGEVGNDGGEVTYNLGAGCMLSYPEATAVSTDCNGVTTYVRGQAVVTGSKTVTGFLTGDPETPVVPTSRDPAVIELDAKLNDFEVWTSAGNTAFTVVHGMLGGTVQPRTALDTTTGACSLSTPVVEFSKVDLINAGVRIDKDGATFDLEVPEGQLYAQSGKKGDVENRLMGYLHADGREVVLPTNPDDYSLDPDYYPLLFRQAYDCNPDMLIPEDEGECTFRKTLAQGAARLLVKTFGTLVKHLDDNGSCGFSSADGLVPSSVSGDAYEIGEMRWDVNSCALGGDSPVKIYTDCNGKEGYIQGYATVSATKRVDGRLVAGYPPVEPQNRDSVSFDMHAIAFNDFRVFDLLPDESTPESYLVLHNGTVNGWAYPITGEAADQPGVYYIKTPVSAFSGIHVAAARVTLVSGAKQFNITLDSSSLDAFNGSYMYRGNELTGTMVVDGQVVEVPIDPDDPGLDPNYDQAVFDASYVCKDNLLEVVPSTTFK